MAEAIRIRTIDTDSPLLSLTGGYDSTSLLGMLAEHDTSRLCCLTYTNWPPPPGGDAVVAAHSTDVVAVPHLMLPAYQLT